MGLLLIILMCSFSRLLLIGILLTFDHFWLHFFLINNRLRLLLLGLSSLVARVHNSVLFLRGLLLILLSLLLLLLSWLIGVG